MKRTSWGYIEYLVSEAKRGNTKAVQQLMHEFGPLINKTSRKIWNRYNRALDLDEIQHNAKHIIAILTLIEYDPQGKAKFGLFIKRQLHARLVQLFRPLFESICVVLPFNDETRKQIETIVPYKSIYNEERIHMYYKLCNHIDTHFNERERKIVHEHILAGRSRDQIAKEYGVSYQRMKWIHLNAMYKLRQYLKKFKIHSRKDI